MLSDIHEREERRSVNLLRDFIAAWDANGCTDDAVVEGLVRLGHLRDAVALVDRLDRALAIPSLTLTKEECHEALSSGHECEDLAAEPEDGIARLGMDAGYRDFLERRAIVTETDKIGVEDLVLAVISGGVFIGRVKGFKYTRIAGKSTLFEYLVDARGISLWVPVTQVEKYSGRFTESTIPKAE